MTAQDGQILSDPSGLADGSGTTIRALPVAVLAGGAVRLPRFGRYAKRHAAFGRGGLDLNRLGWVTAQPHSRCKIGAKGEDIKVFIAKRGFHSYRPSGGARGKGVPEECATT